MRGKSTMEKGRMRLKGFPLVPNKKVYGCGAVINIKNEDNKKRH
jgi:hypothetical protein